MSIQEKPLLAGANARRVQQQQIKSARARASSSNNPLASNDTSNESEESSVSLTGANKNFNQPQQAKQKFTNGAFRNQKSQEKGFKTNHTDRHPGGSSNSTRKSPSFCDLFRFATIADKLLILLGSLFAVVEGAGGPLMALVFGGMTNTLIQTVQFGFAPLPAAGDDGVTIAPTTAAATTTLDPAANATDQLAAPIELITAEEFEARMAYFSLFYVAIGVAVYLSSLIQITCWQTSCERQVHRIRIRFFKSVLRQELSWFDRNQAGELAAKFNDDIERIRDGTGDQFSSVIKHSSSFLSGFIVGFIVSWRLTLVITCASPLLAMFSAYLGKMLATSTKREQEKYAQAGALAEEVLVAIRTVFSLNGQRQEIRDYKRKLHDGKQMAKLKYLKLSFIIGCSMFVLYATYGLALYVSTLLIVDNKLTPGAAMSVIMAVMMGASALGNIIPPLQTIAMAFSSAALVYEIIDSVPRIDASNDRGLRLSKVTANIKMENVSFSYPTRSSVPVIKNLNFDLQQGRTVAICGRTGSGKSTILNLLLRFYDPQSGSIYLDNCNLCDLNVAWLRSLIGIVEQEPVLFDCSIYENISLGARQDSEKSLEKIVEASKLANAHEFIISLPDSYNTRCGDRGVQMSGGQKQRIAIARALLCDPRILLLDEATSALDSENEHLVQQALNKARYGRTTIIIAHRLSTIKDADMICVMNEGEIVEMGQHEELMASKGDYYNLVTNQVFCDLNEAGSAPPEIVGAASSKQQAQMKQMAVVSRSSNQQASNSSSNNLWLACSSVLSEFDSSVASQADLTDPFDSDSNVAYEQHRKITDTSTFKQALSSNEEYYNFSSARRKSSMILYETIRRPLVKKSTIDLRQAELKSRGKTPELPLEMPTFKDIMALCKPELGTLIVAVFFTILSGALMPTFALFYAQIFDTFTKSGDELVASGSFWALMFIALAGANFVTMFFRIYFMSLSFENTMARLRSECFTNIMRQHVGWFDMSQNSAQRLTTRLASDIPQIKAVLNSRVSSLISGVATMVAALFIAFYLGWQLAILLTAALPILLYVGYIQMKMSRGNRAQHVKRMENASRLATEAIENVKLIQAINQEQYFFQKFNRELELPFRDSLKTARRFGLIYGLSQSVIYFIYGAAFRWGAYLMARQVLDPITVFRIFFSIAFTAIAVGQWGGIGGDMSRANYACALIMEMLRTQPIIDNLSRGGIMPTFKGLISFQDVHFKYPSRDQNPVLQGLNLTIKPGQTLALVGPSGQGKSTLAALLLRFYDPDRGTVRIDHLNVKCINLNHLRQSIGLVSQEPCLFKTSIRENILYGLDKSRYSMRDVVNAAKMANIHDFIQQLPEAYETQVGDRGSQMSGGQKQRIAIARTLIRNPTILILDEATSALDAESEAKVNEALDKASRGKTCIKIAHRLSTVRDADQIAVLERGQVVEIGTHDELMALGKRGHYFRLMQKQDICA